MAKMTKELKDKTDAYVAYVKALGNSNDEEKRAIQRKLWLEICDLYYKIQSKKRRK